MKNKEGYPDSDEKLFYSWRFIILCPVGVLIAFGVLWFAREVLGLENMRPNRIFALFGAGIACGIWREIFGPSQKNDSKHESKNDSKHE